MKKYTTFRGLGKIKCSSSWERSITDPSPENMLKSEHPSLPLKALHIFERSLANMAWFCVGEHRYTSVVNIDTRRKEENHLTAQVARVKNKGSVRSEV